MGKIIEIRKVAFTAHNKDLKFPSYNENYNEAHKLGNHIERAYLKIVARDKHGLDGTKKRITKKDVEEWRSYITGDTIKFI